ncbi:MAG TPA: M14 family zinc carboxypeptidase, partial [Bacteroidales bacterium]|nr:M14 family zinc carboxypeptidase [Bacteroidales bacterium]
LGFSEQNDTIPALIIYKDKADNPTEIANQNKATLMIQAGIHAGEPDGIDAGFMLIRTLFSNTNYLDLLNKVTIIFIPVFNVDGLKLLSPYHRINQNGPELQGWRANAHNLNLNRDYMKASSVEMKYWLQFYYYWNPDLFIDCHTTDGADYQYVMTFDMQLPPFMSYNFNNFFKTEFIPYFINEMDKKGFLSTQYVAFRNWFSPESGLAASLYSPILSHGYPLLNNRPALLLETHMLKPYKQRVLATHQALLIVIEWMNNNKNMLKNILSKEDEFSLSKVKTKMLFPIEYKLANHQSKKVLKGYEMHKVISPITGLSYYTYDNTKPMDWTLDFWDSIEVKNNITLPFGYIIGPEWKHLMEILKLHQISFITFSEETNLKVQYYYLTNLEFDNSIFEGTFRPIFSYQLRDTLLKFPKGSYFIPINQKAWKRLVYLLEPESSVGFMQMGYFNSMFERKEYGEIYVLDTLAQNMLKDKKIAAAFEEKKSAEPDFAKDGWAQLMWFYDNSPWKDQRRSTIPVFKVMDEVTFNKINN